MYKLSPTPPDLTCFQNGTFSYTLLDGTNLVGNITLQAPPPSLCPACKQVLDGPLQNLYELVSENEPRCKDGCRYKDPEGREFCFEAGQYQVKWECPLGPGPIKTTIQN